MVEKSNLKWRVYKTMFNCDIIADPADFSIEVIRAKSDS